MEFLSAMESYGIPAEQLILFDFQVRHFPAHRQEILEELVRLNRRIVPDLVLAPSLHDVHQDHHTIAEEAIRAFKRTSILGYEEPWNNLTFNNQVYVTLEERPCRKEDRRRGAVYLTAWAHLCLRRVYPRTGHEPRRADRTAVRPRSLRPSRWIL